MQQHRGKNRPVVAHVTRCYYNLSENWIHTQVRHLKRYQPFVMTQYTANEEEWKGDVPYHALRGPVIEHYLNYAFLRVFGFFPSYWVLAKTRRARVVHAHFGPQGVRSLPLARALGCPLVITFYGYDASLLPEKKPEWKEKYRALFEGGNLFLVEGPHLAGQLRRLGCPASKINVQHLGVPLEKYPYQPRRLKKDDPLRILSAGRFTEKKGFPDAVDAFVQLVRAGVDARLTLIGDSKRERDGHEKQRILDAVADAGLHDRITLMGMQPHDRLMEAYYDHHVFLSPSVQAADGDNEGGAPVTLIEAAATGMPVVATRHCDIPEVVRHEESGFLAPEHDSRQLAMYLKRFEETPGLLQEMGRAGREHVEVDYDAAKQGRRLEMLYDAVL